MILLAFVSFFWFAKKVSPHLVFIKQICFEYIYIYIYRKERECVMFKSQTWIYHIHSFIFFPSKMMHLIIKEITIQAKRDLSVLYMCSVCMRKDSYCGCWISINNLVARHLGAFNMCTVGMRKDSYCGCWISINNLVAIHLGAFNMCTVGMRKDSL